MTYAQHIREEIVRRSEAKPESLLEAAPAMLSVDQAGVIRFANRLTELLFGLDRDKLIGQPVEILMPESFPLIQAEHQVRHAADAENRSSGASVALTGRHQDGSEFPINVNLSNIDSGDVLLVITAAHVASGQHALERAGLAAAIVESADDAIIASRLDGTITSWNPGAERMYGYSRTEIIGRSFSVLTPQDRAGESVDVLAKVAAAQAVERLETNRVRKDGTVVPVSITVAPIRDSDGAVVGASIIHRDVTEHRQAFENTRRMAAIVEDSLDAIVSTTLAGVLTSWNPAAQRMFGYSSEEIIGRSAEVLVAEGETDVVRAVLEQIAVGQHVADLEATCLRKDGVVFPVAVTVSPIRDADGAIIGASAVARDTSEHRAALEAAQLMKAIIENSEEAISSSTPDGIITTWNPAAERMFGYSGEEIVGRPVNVLRPKELDGEVPDVLAKIKAGQPVVHQDTYRIRKDGELIPVSVSISPIRDGDGALLGASAILRNRSDERRAFEASQRLAAIVDSSDDAIIGKTLDGIVTSWNLGAARMYGYASEEIIGKSIFVLSPPERTEEIETILANIRIGQNVKNLETERLRKDGTVFHASLTVSAIRDADGVIIGASTIARDVTEQRQAFEAAQRMAAIVHSSGEAIISGALDGTILSWNPAAEKMYGYTSEEIVGHSAASLIPEDKVDELHASLAKVMAGQHIENLETNRIRKDGTVIPVSLAVSPIRDAGGAMLGVSLIARDLTETRHAAQYARSLIEAGLDPLVSISPQGLVDDVNEAMIEVTGVPRAELIGTEFFEYFTEPAMAKRIYKQVLAEGIAMDYALTMRHRDGALTEVRYNASVYRDIRGNVLGVFAVARDVTKQMQAQREISEQQVKALDKVVELEAFQRLTVGRELKMIDLKKEIEFLRRHVAD